MERIFNDGSQQEEMNGEMGSMEIGRADYAEAFLTALCNMIVEALAINWKDRNIVHALLRNALNNDVRYRNGLLEQYLHSQLKIIGDEIINQFKLSKDLKPNYNYATHAKFRDIIDAIENTQTKAKGK